MLWIPAPSALPGMMTEEVDLLPVLGHHLVASLADAMAVLPQALQHDRITVIHDGAAKARDIAGAGVLARSLLREGAGRNEREGNNNKQPDHVTPFLKSAIAGNGGVLVRVNPRGNRFVQSCAKCKTTQAKSPRRFECFRTAQSILLGNLLAFGGEVPVHDRAAAGRELGAVLVHAGCDRRDVGDFGAAELEGVARAHLLRLG
jgi:hypothetical protein